jgi:regulator of nucleoside diphosphate kinase
MKKTTNNLATIYITSIDHERLGNLIEVSRERDGEMNREYLDELESELDRAEIVDQKDIPDDVITMRSMVRLKDLVTGDTNIYSLVFPTEANLSEGKISILAPVGTAMLGYRLGDVIEGQVPSGLRRLRVEEVVYQPESAQDYHL